MCQMCRGAPLFYGNNTTLKETSKGKTGEAFWGQRAQQTQNLVLNPYIFVT